MLYRLGMEIIFKGQILKMALTWFFKHEIIFKIIFRTISQYYFRPYCKKKVFKSYDSPENMIGDKYNREHFDQLKIDLL